MSQALLKLTDNTSRIHWRLSELMARRRIRSATELHRRLGAVGVDISSSHLSRMIMDPPTRLNVDLLGGLMEVLDCEASDLIGRRHTHTPADAGSHGGGATGDEGSEAAQNDPPRPPISKPPRSITRPQRKAKSDPVSVSDEDLVGPKVSPFPRPQPKG